MVEVKKDSKLLCQYTGCAKRAVFSDFLSKPGKQINVCSEHTHAVPAFVRPN